MSLWSSIKLQLGATAVLNAMPYLRTSGAQQNNHFRAHDFGDCADASCRRCGEINLGWGNGNRQGRLLAAADCGPMRHSLTVRW